MLDYIGDFKTGIMSKIREVNVNLAYKDENDKEHYLDSEDIQQLTQREEMLKEMGGVVRKVVNATLMVSEKTEHLKNGSSFNLIYKVGKNGQCSVDLFFINSVVKNDKNQTVKIEGVDYITYTKDTSLPFVTMSKNTYLVDFLRKIVLGTTMKLNVGYGVINPLLKLAYPKSYVLRDNLDEMGIAMNGIITTKSYGEMGVTLPTIVPFTFNQYSITGNIFLTVRKFDSSTSVEEFTFQNSLLEVTVNDDENNHNQVSISLFNPSSSNSKDLGNITKEVPAMTNSVNLGIMEFDNSVLTQVIHFDEDVDVVDYDISMKRNKVVIDTKTLRNDDVTVSFRGVDFNQISNTEESESNTKIINNLYIQSPNVYDTKVYTGKDVTVKYTGNPLVEVGDVVTVDSKKIVLLTHELSYNGALRGKMKGVWLDG